MTSFPQSFQGKTQTFTLRMPQVEDAAASSPSWK